MNTANGVERLKKIIKQNADEEAARIAQERRDAKKRADDEAKEIFLFHSEELRGFKNIIEKRALRNFRIVRNRRDAPAAPIATLDEAAPQGAFEFLEGEGDNRIKKTSFDVVDGARVILKNAVLEDCKIKISNPEAILYLTGNFKETNIEYTEQINNEAYLAGDFEKCNIKNSFILNGGKYEEARSFFDSVKQEKVIEPLTPTIFTASNVFDSIILSGGIIKESTLNKVQANAPLRAIKSELNGIGLLAPLNAEISGITNFESDSETKAVDCAILNTQFKKVLKCSLLRCDVINQHWDTRAYGEWIDNKHKEKEKPRPIFEQ